MQTINTQKHLIKWLSIILGITLGFIACFTTYANDNVLSAKPSTSISVGYNKNSSAETIDKLIKKSKTQEYSAQQRALIQGSSIQTSSIQTSSIQRNSIKSAVNLDTQQATSARLNNSRSSSMHVAVQYDYQIYDAYSLLVEDFDEDGYFQTFSINFDADINSDVLISANVYAELYLRKDGGPWVHYYTSDEFIITGNSEDDQYEIYTTLEQGYNRGHYDVLIDLYEVGYEEIVASYSSDDNSSLFSLPLESSNKDVIYVEYVAESYNHGGSISILLLMILAICLLRRIKNVLY